jgi:hypothetical protein
MAIPNRIYLPGCPILLFWTLEVNKKKTYQIQELKYPIRLNPPLANDLVNRKK